MLHLFTKHQKSVDVIKNKLCVTYIYIYLHYLYETFEGHLIRHFITLIYIDDAVVDERNLIHMTLLVPGL